MVKVQKRDETAAPHDRQGLMRLIVGSVLFLLVVLLSFTTSKSWLPVDSSQLVIKNDFEITIIQKHTKDILASAPVPRSNTAPQSLTPKISPLQALPTKKTTLAANIWQGPRLKPRGQPVPATSQRLTFKAIDVNAARLAPRNYIGFALTRDFTGGQRSFLSDPFAIPTPKNDQTESYFLTRGETLSTALSRTGIRTEDKQKAIRALSTAMNMRKLQPGQKLTLRTVAPTLSEFQEAALSPASRQALPRKLLSLSLKKDRLTRIDVTRPTGQDFSASTTVAPTSLHYATIRGEITDSLFASAARTGAPRDIVAKLANLFLFDIDFQREIRKGDQFEAVYEVYYDDQGKVTSYGDVIFGRMSWLQKRKSKGYYKFIESGKAQWFTKQGKSARRLLMKTPIDGARITSGFGRRRHPVLGYTKKHKGVDFGARRGSPIMAAGNGTVLRANRYGSYGNYVKIRHANGYQTAYAHLKSFAKGVRKGRKVRQGQIIGYVGTTGRSTGPHLHYEVLRRGKHINPMRIKVATGKTLAGDILTAFTDERDWIEAMRLAPNTAGQQHATNQTR